MANAQDSMSTLTVGELKTQLNLYDDECLISFSAIAGQQPTYCRLKNWARDAENNVTEIIVIFNES